MLSHSDVSPNREELLPTRRSLLDRLRDWEDQASWREFFNIYWKFIYSVAIKSGLTDQEAEDVVQETMLSVAKKMPDFVYDPARCSFKGWLMHVIRLRLIDQLRRRLPAGCQSPAGDHDSRQTPTIERIPDLAGGAPPLDAIWDAIGVKLESGNILLYFTGFGLSSSDVTWRDDPHPSRKCSPCHWRGSSHDKWLPHTRFSICAA